MTKNTEMASSVSPAAPEAVNVYDAHAGKYYDTVCHTTPAPAYMPLPGTPSPFVLKGTK
jgi:hypothetical protein